MPKGRFLSACERGLRRALASTYRLLIMIVPVSLAVNVLDWVGLLRVIGHWLAPVLSLVGLPGEAAVSLISGALVGVYAGIAALVPLHLTLRQINILAVMILVAHSLPLEGAVQQKSGVSGWRMVLLRLGASFGLGLILAHLVPGAAGPIVTGTASTATAVTWTGHLLGWGMDTLRLALKMFIIITTLFLATELLREYGWLERLAKPLRPLMVVLGLPSSAAFAWVTAVVVGLLYGSALIIQEAEQGQIDRDGLVRLNASIAVAHSLLEDTGLFMAVGASLLWLLFPRLLAAAIVARVASYLARPRARVQAQA
ncbi:MAG: nucleoside recognition domain-containing protein [Symbiobacteriia bacterium]